MEKIQDHSRFVDFSLPIFKKTHLPLQQFMSPVFCLELSTLLLLV